SNAVPTPPTKEAFVAQIEAFIAACDVKIDGLSFSLPGFINSATGYISKGGAISYLDKTYFYQLFEHLRLPISLENDGRCFAIAEKMVGAAQGCKDFICFTIGTGVGTGIMVNGELLKGHTFFGGEFGMGYVMQQDRLYIYHELCSMTAL